MTAPITLLRPVDKKFKISSPFGERILEGKKVFHNGVDFAVPVGTPINACYDGVVFKVGWENELNHAQGFGFRIWQMLTIGNDKYYLWYGHTSAISVREGEKIKAGQHIAYSGNTGHSTGPHLHMGIRKRDTADFLPLEFVETLI